MKKVNISRTDPTRYAYAVGKIRALETRLLDAVFLERMIEAPSPEAAFKILSEVPEYQEDIQRETNPRDFEKVLEHQLKKLYLLMEKLFYEKQIIDAFKMRYDFANAKAVIRNLFLKEKQALEFFEFGVVQPEKLANAIEGKNFREIPGELASAIRKAVDYFEETKDPQGLDFILDKAWCNHAYWLTENFSFINEYFKSFIDLNNTMAFLRCKISKKDAGLLKNALIENGKIPVRDFLKLYDRPYHELHIELSRRDYLKYIKDGIDEAFNKGSLERLEKDADDYLILYLRRAKHLTFGFEPVFGYMKAKENETSLIRNIMIGKIYDQPLEQIRRGQRQSYV